MKTYLALVEAGDATHAYGVRFPDLPGVFSAADEEGDVLSNAIEALQLWAEDEELPEPSAQAALVQRSDVREALSAGCYLMAVPLIENDTAVVRANVTFERGVLQAIDVEAGKRGLTRASFLAQAARHEIERVPVHRIASRITATKRAAIAKPAQKPSVKSAAGRALSKPAAKAAASPSPAKRMSRKPSKG